MSKARQYLFHSRMTRTIFLIFVLCAILPVVGLGVFSIRQAKTQMTEQYRSLASADALRVTSILFDITTSAYTSSESILAGNECMYLFASETPSDAGDQVYYSHIEAALSALAENSASISSIHIYTDNPKIQSGPYISPMAADYAGEEWYSKIQENTWSTWLLLSNTANPINRSVSQLSLVRRIPVASARYTAYLVIRLDSNYIKNRIGDTSHLVMASLDDGPIFYASDYSRTGTTLPLPADFDRVSSPYIGETEIDGTSLMSALRILRPYKTENLFYIEVADTAAKTSINRISMIYYLIIVFVILVTGMIIFFFSIHLSKRINTLKEAMHQARLGDYNIIETFQGNDELQETFQDLKATVEEISRKESEYYAEQITRQKLINRQQQMEFKMLASQINPHFLYNTLETIRMQALAGGSRDVATSIKLLGKAMRYVLENTGTDFTTLDRELDYINTYLSIQKLRFGNRINYRFDVAEDVKPSAYPILPLLLQPIVENAVIHGLEEAGDNGLVVLAAFRVNDRLCLTVQDNGQGMDEEALAALRQKLTTPDNSSRSSIGLYNIYQRIKLCYGNRAEMTIESAPGAGTKVTLLLPLPDSPGSAPSL